MAVFELDSPMRAVREAMRHSLPGRAIILGVGGVLAAAGICFGLTAGVGSGIDDPAPYPNAKAAPAPAPLLYFPALAEQAAAPATPSLNSAAVPITDVSIAFGAPRFMSPSEPMVEAAPTLSAPISVTEPLVAATQPTAVAPQASAAQPVAVSKPAPVVQPVPVSQSAVAPIVAPQPAVAPAPVVAAAPVVAPVPAVEPAPAVAPVPAGPGFYMPPSVGSDAGLESRLLEGINAERAQAGLPAYAFDGLLVKIARTRSQQMVDQGYFGHTDANGMYMYTALLGYYGVGYAWAGENLALNNFSIAESPARALVSLMNSPTHRANILANDFSRIGIGVVVHGDGRRFYSMIFIG